MIDRTFLHLPGVGPVTERRLQAQGMLCWEDVLADPQAAPLANRRLAQIVRDLKRCRDALRQNNLRFLCDTLVKREQWRILAQYVDRVSYFDIETSDFDYQAHITVIVCLHRGRLRRFVWGENLDDFLDLLDEVDLLASFNGTTFDIPVVLRHFHIPELPCPHIDLRWQCYHCGFRGGLKEVERQLQIERPPAVAGVDGTEAIWLWQRWRFYQDADAREQLIRYCGVDVLSLPLLTGAILHHKLDQPFILPEEGYWSLVDQL